MAKAIIMKDYKDAVLVGCPQPEMGWRAVQHEPAAAQFVGTADEGQQFHLCGFVSRLTTSSESLHATFVEL